MWSNFICSVRSLFIEVPEFPQQVTQCVVKKYNAYKNKMLTYLLAVVNNKLNIIRQSQYC